MLPYSATIMVCFVLGLMTGSSFGETVEITLTSNLAEVQTLITKELTLECDISLVTQRSSQVTNVSYIDAIEITDQDGDTVVSIQKGQRKPFIRAKGFGDKGAEAAFDVGFPTGYLLLIVPNPDKSTTCDSTTCRFTCNGTVYRTIEDTPTIIQDETTVTWKETPNNELVDIVYKMKNEMLVNINKEIVNNNKEIKNINNEKLVNMNNEIVNNNNEMVKKRQITQDTKLCTPPNVNQWHHVHVNFRQTYAKPPRVFLSRRYNKAAYSGGVRGHNNNVIIADKITTTGFRLRCWAYNKMDYLQVTWIAFPSP